MINALYNLALDALKNAQVSISNTSNNIANADTVGYQRTTTNYSTSPSITVYGLTVGTGATVDSITSELDKFVEAQYLDASAEYNRQNTALSYLSDLDSLLNQSEDTGLSVTLSDFWDAWNDLATDPSSTSAREALLGASQTLIYALNSASEELETMTQSINSEIQSQVSEANDLIDAIAELNAQIAANPEDNTAVSDRDEKIRELNELIGIKTIEQDNGQVTVLTDEGYSLVDGTSTHHLVAGEAQATEALTRDSAYDGDIQYSGTSSEEILIQFVSSGTDGTAQFKVSLDGGETWLTDDDGNTLLYTAGGESDLVNIAGVDIWFDGSTEHAVGDRYTIVPKVGLYWESGDGNLVNITPMTDADGSDVDGRTSGGSLAGLFNARDDGVVPTLEALDDLAEALVWEVNSAHSQGAGLEAHTSLVGTYSVEDQTAVLSNCGLTFEDKIQAGTLSLVTYDADGNVATTGLIDIDPAADSLEDVVDKINTAFGGELTASINSDGQLVLAAASDTTFEVASDSSDLLAALGLNTVFTGTDAGDIGINDYVAEDTSHFNTGMVGDDGLVASGSNDTASTLAGLGDTTVTIGSGSSATSSSLTEYLAALVSSVGSAASSAETKATFAGNSADYYSDKQSSASGVNVDEELVNLTKYQQSYQAAAKMIEVTKSMMDTLLDMI